MARLALATYVAIVHVVFLYMLLTDGGGTAASAGTAGAGATAVVGADNTANVVATTPDDQLDAGKTPLVAGG